MTVVQFKRPDPKRKTSGNAGSQPPAARRPLAQFAVAMAMTGLVFFLLPTLWASAPVHLLVVIHLLIAVVYVQQGPRIAAAVWIALTLAVLVITGSPSPVTYALARGAAAFDAAIPR